MPAARRDELLDQRHLIESELEAALVRGALQVLRPIEPDNPGAAAADVGFHHDGKAQAGSRRGRLRWLVNHPGCRKRKPE